MNSFTFKQKNIFAVLTAFVTIAALSFLMSGSAQAAPPYSVTYNGTPTTTAVPGTPVTVSLKVTNTGSTVYSGVKVIIHVPEGVTHSAVSPGGSSVIDDTITWSDVPIAAGKSFFPSVTVTMDSGTAIGKKKSLWVEVTGENMEANSQNFSLTAVKTVKTTTTSSSSGTDIVPLINSIHRAAYDRNPTASEHTYWWGRVTSGDKTTQSALLGAMQFHKLNAITH